MSYALRLEDCYVTPEEYLAGERMADHRHEYLAGVVRAMAGATRAHGQIISNLSRELGNQLRGKRCEPLSTDIKVRIRTNAATFFYYPDVIVDCTESPDPRSLFADEPTVIFEVSSLSSEQTDRAEKLSNYCTLPTLRTYVVVNQHHPVVFAYRRDAGGEWQLEFLSGPDATLRLPEIECTLPLSAVYERVVFA